MRRLRRAKIVATLGPASSDAAMIAKLFKAGADVFRINMSHTSQDRMRELVAMIRGIEKDTGRPIGILVDLQGPKLRLGTFAGGSAMVASGASFVLDSDPAPGDATRAYLPHPEIFAAVAPGRTLLIDDGKVRLTVTQAEPKRMTTRVEVAGKLSDRKGVSLPDSTIPFSALAEKDRSDLEAALNAGIDWVALSFIQRPEDIAEAKKSRGAAPRWRTRTKPGGEGRAERQSSRRRADGGASAWCQGAKWRGSRCPEKYRKRGRATRQTVGVATQMLESTLSLPTGWWGVGWNRLATLINLASIVLVGAIGGERRRAARVCRRRPAPTPSPTPPARSPRRSISLPWCALDPSGSTGGVPAKGEVPGTDRWQTKSTNHRG